MTQGKSAVEFEQLINAGRERRKNESLANEIFSRGRRQSAPGAPGPRRLGASPSLASRIGVSKRSNSIIPKPRSKLASAGNVNADWTHDLHTLNNPTASQNVRPFARSSAVASSKMSAREGRLISALASSSSSPDLNSQFKIVDGGGGATGKGMSIRGIAGPCAVMAQNFAPGTTAADIESAMASVGGVILNCRMVSATPLVVAEIVFESRDSAENAIQTFNNQTADGRLLRLYIKSGPVTLPRKTQQQQQPPSLTPPISAPLGPRADLITGRNKSSKYTGSSDKYEQRGRSRSRERGRNSWDRNGNNHNSASTNNNNTSPGVVDGSYGFDDRMDTDDNNNGGDFVDDRNDNGRGGGRALYSDRLDRGRQQHQQPGRGYDSGGGGSGGRAVGGQRRY